MASPHFEEYALRLSVALADKAEVMLATDLERLKRDYDNRVFPEIGSLKLKNVGFRSLHDALSLLVNLVRFRPDVIHLQEASGLRKAIVCAFLVLMTRGNCKIALTVHDPQPHAGRDAKIAQRLDWCRRYVRSKADVVFVHGEFCFERYIEAHQKDSQKVVIAEHGELLSDTPPTSKDEDSFSLLCFGRMEAYKGIGVFHNALSLLSQSGIEPKVTIVGTGPGLDEFADGFSKMPNVKVENAFAPSSRLIEALNEADAVVMPYLEASQSGVLAAALANGRFVIASEVGGIPDVVEHMVNGVLVPPADAPALADAIRKVSESPTLRQRLSKGAMRTRDERLNWNKIAGTVLDAY
jgi:glycosyltransferase involved in cell wall biosynthesis